VPKIHPSAIVETDSIGEGVSIGEFAVLRPGVTVGDDVTIHPHVVVEDGIELGSGTEILPGSFLGRRPRAVGAIARDPSYEERLQIGANCIVGPLAIVYYDVEIGPEVLIGDGASIRELCRVGSKAVIGRGVTLDRAVSIGSGTRVMDKAHLTGGMVIGEGVFISAMVVTTNDSTFGRDYVEQSVRGPSIDSGAMIGGGASLLPGVHIGRDAIVGSGAVVTADVEPETMVLGVPARPVKRTR
jgi:UDP-3-O-[3-hydroxymyristoyl] glucosamine N-acyltransferase